MTEKEKIHDAAVAYNLLRDILDDTNEEFWAYKYLTDALAALDDYFETCEKY